VQGAILAGKSEADTGAVDALNPNSVRREEGGSERKRFRKEAAGGFGPGVVAQAAAREKRQIREQSWTMPVGWYEHAAARQRSSQRQVRGSGTAGVSALAVQRQARGSDPSRWSGESQAPR